MNKNDAKNWYEKLTPANRKKLQEDFNDPDLNKGYKDMNLWIQSFSIRTRHKYTDKDGQEN